MEKIIIRGQRRLNGSIRIKGAKNSILPILAGAVLNSSRQKIVLKNAPDLLDVRVMLRILNSLGVTHRWEDSSLELDTSNVLMHAVPDDLMREMRSSIFLIGPLLGRLGKVQVTYPGGCAIGPRPIDLHIKGLKALGATIWEDAGRISVKADRLRGADIHLDFPSVGATENLMMAGVLAKGTTTLYNAAKEPEIVDLQNFLNSMGAKINGAGTSIIRVHGVDALGGTVYRLIPDRIVAGTFMIAAAITGGQIILKDVIPDHLDAVIAKLRETGVEIVSSDAGLKVAATGKLQALDTVRTLPYPGFPTDLQAPMMSLLTIAEGTSLIIENVFEGRFKHVPELRRMNANIFVEGRTAVIKGVPMLTGATVETPDLRAGAALILAGLAAQGTTKVLGVHHIDRGYEKIEEQLKAVGADIKRIREP